jgi:ABC-type antimicrobial peptide transport system permease subunit
MRSILRKLWQFLSFIFVLYGFYLLFLFIWDTMIRVNEALALPLAVLITLAVMAVSGFLWARKRVIRPQA